MRVVVIGSAKGGVGKSTLAAALAVEAERQGNHAAIVDFDNLQCVARWHDRRVIETGSGTPLLIDAKTPAKAVAQAVKAGCDWLLIDTAPASLARVQPALAVADLCVVPVRPSPLDVQCMDAIIELCGASGRQTLVVLNAVIEGSQMTKGARDYLRKRGFNLWDGEITSNEIHPRAMITGLTASELEPGNLAANEISALWASVELLCAGHTEARQRQRSKGRSVE